MIPVLAPFTVEAPPGITVAAIVMGAAAGPQFPSLYLNGGDIIGPRNVQCGSNTDPNCDIGAGSTTSPGVLSLNYDIGRELRIYDGRKRLIARFGRDGITFYVRPCVQLRGHRFC